MSEVLESIFGSKEKTRLIRFFVQNPGMAYPFSEIVKKNMISNGKGRRELITLSRIRMVRKRVRGGRNYYQLNENFGFYPELKLLIAKANIYPQCQSLGKVSKVGNIKLAVVSGVFISYPKSKADMIIVGDAISKAKLRNLMGKLEAEVGKEINFVLMTMDEFKYRLNMLDKFVLEFLEGPHEEIVNKITGLKQLIAKRKS